MLAVGIWLALLLFTMEVLRLYTLGRLFAYTAMAAAFVGILYLCEKVVLLDRRAFTCKRCGYDLHALPEPRCPECGTDFDPAERERILARIHSPPPKARHRWIVALIVVLLALAVAGGMVLWRQASKGAAGPAAAPTTQSSLTTLQGSE